MTRRRQRRKLQRRLDRRTPPSVPWWAIAALVLAVIAVAAARLLG